MLGIKAAMPPISSESPFLRIFSLENGQCSSAIGMEVKVNFMNHLYTLIFNNSQLYYIYKITVEVIVEVMNVTKTQIIN